MLRVAFICLGSYTITSWNKHQNFDRQSLYSIALQRALNFADDIFLKEYGVDSDFFLIDNTISKKEDILEELREQFTHPRIRDVQLVNNNVLGSQNKGAGEYFMCKAVIDKHSELLKNYDWIVYYHELFVNMASK